MLHDRVGAGGADFSGSYYLIQGVPLPLPSGIIGFGLWVLKAFVENVA